MMGRHLGCVGTLLVLTLRGAVGGGEFGAAAPAADAIMSGMFAVKKAIYTVVYIMTSERRSFAPTHI